MMISTLNLQLVLSYSIAKSTIFSLHQNPDSSEIPKSANFTGFFPIFKLILLHNYSLAFVDKDLNKNLPIFRGVFDSGILDFFRAAES